MQNVAYILSLVFLAGAYRLTYLNSPKYAHILLAIVILSWVIAQFKQIQLWALLGIVGCLVVMVMSRFEREKDLNEWYLDHNFIKTNFTKAPALFPYHSNNGTIVYSNFLTTIEGFPCLFSEQFHSYRIGSTASVVVRCSYYFNGKADLNDLEKRFVQHKRITSKSAFFERPFQYFSLEDCDIFKPEMGGIVVSWRLQTTVAGYAEKYEWIRQALLNPCK